MPTRCPILRSGDGACAIKNTSWWNLHDLLWEPVRAIGSSNRFYIDKLDELMWRRGDSFPFMEAFPDTRATGGNLALDDDGWWRLHEDLGIRNEAALVKHLLNKHEGEMRLVGVDYWVDLSGTGRDSRHIVYHSRFFHSQTMRTEEMRNFCFWNHGAGAKDPRFKDTYLPEETVDNIMRVEQNQTRLIMRVPATGGQSAGWKIRQGNYITLGELFLFGVFKCSRWDMYRTYMSLEIVVTKKPHSISNSPNAILRQHAKNRSHDMTGRWSLRW